MNWFYRCELLDQRSRSILRAEVFSSPAQLDANKLPNASVSAVNKHSGAQPYAIAAAIKTATHELVVYEQDAPRGQPTSMWGSPIARFALRQ